LTHPLTEKQDAEGQFSLGYAFEYGEGVQMKDLREAVKYYKLAAGNHVILDVPFETVNGKQGYTPIIS
jgi:hypothetical protein